MPDLVDRLKTSLADRYAIDRELGRGGMATVYLAEDLKHHRQVAIKVLRPELASAVGPERFLREIEIAAGLNHPHILPLLDSGKSDGFLFYVMPYVEGESLRDKLERETQLPLEDALQVAREVGSALGSAHAQGVLHRDIKPENILLHSGHAVVADFGIARAIDVAGGEQVTRTGVAVGTPGYMSPEQATAESEIDARSDIYSLACVLYEMLAGTAPFDGPTPRAVITRHLVEPAPRLSAVRDVPVAVEAAVAKALEKTPADRFAGATEFVEALTQGVAPRRSAFRNRLRQRAVWLWGLLAVIATGGGLLLVILSGSDPGSNTPEGEELVAALTEPLGRASVAVLPLTKIAAGEEEAEVLTAGLHSEIITQLGKIAALEVIGRTSVARYASTEKSAREIGQELGVANVLEGSVLLAAGQVRLNVQLTDATTDRQLWAEAYASDYTIEQLFRILEDIPTQIAAALQIALTPEEQQQVAEPPTDVAEAYEQYLRGESLRARGAGDAAGRAYVQALALDTDFAVAWARLSELATFSSWLQGGSTEVEDPPNPEFAAAWARLVEVVDFPPLEPGGRLDLIDVAAKALERARELAPDAAGTMVAQGAYHLSVDVDYERAAEQFERALELRPNDPYIILQLGRTRTFQRRWVEAERRLRRALDLDPFLADAAEYLGNVLRNTGRYREAARYLDRAADLAPADGPTAAIRMHTYLWGLGDTATVRDFIEQGSYPFPDFLQRLRAQLAYLRRDADALERLAQDSLAPQDSVARYNWLTRVALLRADAGLRVTYGDSLVQLLTRRLDTTLGMEDSGYRDFMIGWWHAFLGTAYALSGEEGKAVRAAGLAAEAVPLDFLDRNQVYHQVVLTYTFLRHTDTALDWIEHELSQANTRVTPVSLRIDPDFDALRDHSRFQALLEEYR